jgi:predicted metalloprotease with PDZ domain
VINYEKWSSIATGLKSIPGKKDEFHAPDFDILYDCPILAGNLDELPSFSIGGIRHRFTGYNPGSFNREEFISNLAAVVKAGTDLMGHIPYDEYTFLAIGPGMGGIEHLNNCTVSFNGNGLGNREAMLRTLNFLAHEYFHNYNVKRIRPYELGPFDYGSENRTNLLWLSEGMTVYYEYLIVKRAGLTDDQDLFRDFEGSISAAFNDQGKAFQTLAQASYSTWDDGPFGQQGKDDRSISVYDKGTLMGLVLDFSIRNATSNRKSLDDVMRFLYNKYYRQEGRGFTDAEFQKACETIAGQPLTREFEYLYKTGDIDLNYYLAYAGLQVISDPVPGTGKLKFTISRIAGPDELQSAILRSWLGE